MFPPVLGAGLVFEGFFYLPLGVYLYYFYPAWSWMYFFDPGSLKPLTIAVLGVLMVLSYLISLVLGFQLARLLIQSDRQKIARFILAMALIGLGAFCLLTLDRLLWVGDYEGWKKGTNAVFLLRHRLSWINTLMAVSGFGSLAVLLSKLKK